MLEEKKNNLAEFHRDFVRDFEDSDKFVMRLASQEIDDVGLIHDTPMPIIESTLLDGLEQAYMYGEGLIRDWKETAVKSGMSDLEIKIVSCSIPIKILFDCPFDMDNPSNWVWNTTAFLTSDKDFCIVEIVEPHAKLTHLMTLRSPFWFESGGDVEIPDKIPPTYPKITHNKKNVLTH